MKLTETFWKSYELDLQEAKISYLNWAIGYAREPRQEYRHLFLWNHQQEFCIVNSRYGRSFAVSPFGLGVRGVPRPRYDGIPRGLDEIDLELKSRLALNTQRIRNAGMHIECLQQLLGHSSIEMTLRYARLSDKTREQEYFKAMAIIEGESIHEPDQRDHQLPPLSEASQLLTPYA